MTDDLRGLRTLRLGPAMPPARTVNLRALGFVGRVSDEARAEIERNARRALRVLETADRYWFR